MFAFIDYLNVVAQISTSNVHELITQCAAKSIGIRIDLGGVCIVDRPFNEKYEINVTLCNSKVIPRPIYKQQDAVLHDKQCIKNELHKVSFPMNVEMNGNHVTAFFADGVNHIAIPDLEEACEIANMLGVYDEMIKKRSVNAAIATFVKSKLPNLCFQSCSDIVLTKTAFVFKTDKADQLTDSSVVDCIDVRRCYSTALVHFDSSWTHFSCFDDIDTATISDVMKHAGRYYITTKNYFPLKGPGWYYHSILRYAKAKNILFKVHFGQKASVVYPPNLFHAVVKEIKDKLPSMHSKTVTNRFIGMLKTKSKETTRCFVTKNMNEANAFLKSSFQSYMSYDNGLYFCQAPKIETSVKVSSRHIYDQIIERSWILVHELWISQMKCNAQLVQIKTDAVTVEFATEDDMRSYKIDEERYRREKVQIISSSVADETMPMPVLPEDVSFFNIDHNYKWDGNPLCFVGRAGTAKSTKLREILEEHDGVVISPTNRAASSFKNGMTIHKFFGIKDINCTAVKSKKIHQISQKTKLLLVDEVFMCSAWMLEALYQLHLLGTMIVCAGDPYQLPAVSGRALTCSSMTLRACVNDRFMLLSENMRCELDLSKQLSVSVEKGEFVVPEHIEYRECDFSIRCHLTFTNICTFKINDLVLKNEIRRQRTALYFDECGNWFVVKGIREIPDTCIAFTKTSPVTVRESCAYGMRNERVIINSFNSTHIWINSKRFKICSDMSLLLRLAYSMTIHKSQGSTINERHQIHEISKIKHNKIGAKLLYVALTRTSHIHFVCICKDCKCEHNSAKQLSSRDMFV